MDDSMVAQAPYKRGLLERFIQSEISGSVILLACTILALLWANSPWAESYFHLIHIPFSLSFNGYTLSLSMQHWINDALMAVFFFVVGLEIKREMVVGRLSDLRKAALPVAGALGGMVVPALIYFSLNPEGPAAAGWGVPMATDIAFALGVLSLFGKRVPIGLKVFLAALAIADDLGAVMVIAFFYTSDLHVSGLLVAAIALFLLWLCNVRRMRNIGIYALLILIAWLSIYYSGIHSTVSGILIAFLLPVRGWVDPGHFLENAGKDLQRMRELEVSSHSLIHEHEHLDLVVKMHHRIGDMRPPGVFFEHVLTPVQAFCILPLFAFANAGVTVDDNVLNVLHEAPALGVFLGLFVGKQIGVFLASWTVVKLGLGELPEGVNWKQLYGVSLLAGIGFTMALFVCELAFNDPEVIGHVKLGILTASLTAALVGYAVLHMALPKRASQSEFEDTKEAKEATL